MYKFRTVARVAALFGAIGLAGVSAFGATTIGGPLINPANNHTYFLLSESTWQDSEATAISLGGHLATIDNAAEQSWVFSNFDGLNKNLWIGLFRPDLSSSFQWVSGAPVSYTNWLPGQPDSNVPAPEIYVHMIATNNGFNSPEGGGFWNDIRSPNTGYPELNPLHGVVEIAPVPEPSTVLMLTTGLATVFALRRRRRQ